MVSMTHGPGPCLAIVLRAQAGGMLAGQAALGARFFPLPVPSV